MKRTGWLKIALAGALTIAAAGCAMGGRSQVHRSNNLFKFLYPHQSARIDTPGIPTLSLPLRVGVAFVPAESDKNDWSARRDEAAFSESHKQELLKRVSDQFRSYAFVKLIEVIPTTYLRPGGGFENLEQLQKMYGLDVMALVSYDQAQFTDQGFLSLTYWTVVGAYVIQAEKNETRTMLDAAVYDIASRRLLFRAPGISSVKERSSAVNLNEQLRKDSAKGFEIAGTNLVYNLKAELESFRERVKNAPTEYKVAHRPGYTGAGAAGAFEVSMIAIFGAVACARRFKR